MSKEVKISGLNDLIVRLGTLGKDVNKAMERGLVRGGKAVQMKAKLNIKENDSIVTRQLSQSIHIEVEKAKDGSEIKVLVGTDVPYAPFVELGTSPHWTPKEPIDYWVRRKLGITDEDEIEQISYAVRLKIARLGTEAKPYLKPALDSCENVTIKYIEEELKKLL